MKPKADYFDELVDRNLLTNFRDTAKEFGVKESYFINWLLGKNYIYRDCKGKLQPYAASMDKGLFEIKSFRANIPTMQVLKLLLLRGAEKHSDCS